MNLFLYRLLIATTLISVTPVFSHTKSKELPFVGHQYEVHYTDEQAYLIDFQSKDTLKFTKIVPPNKGFSDTVKYTAKLISDGIYMIYWKESDGSHVVHVDDFKKKISYTNISSKENFYNLSSKIKFIK